MRYPEKVIGKRIQSEAPSKPLTLLTLGIFALIAVVLGAVDSVIAAFATSDSEATVVTTGFTDPDVARTVTLTAGGVAGDVAAVQGVVVGKDIAGNVISESLPAFTVDTLGTVESTKAFAEVTSVTIPAMDGAGVTVSVGTGDKIGLPVYLGDETLYATYFDGSKEGTPPTLNKSTVLAENTADLDSALDGSDIDFYLFV